MKRAYPRPFRWPEFLASHLAASLAIFLIGLILDNGLRAFGIDIPSWREAFYSGLSGFLIATPLCLVLWRVGLVTGPHYLLGGLGLFVPVTILSVLVISRFDNVLITVPVVDGDGSDNQLLAITAYIRIARSAVLFPTYIGVFWFSYHIYFRRLPKRSLAGVES